MAERPKIINIHSNVEGKLPEASVLEYGEIAVNYNENSPKISFKNNKDNIVTISDDNYFIKIIEENEEVISNALNNLNDNKQDNLVSGTNIKTINKKEILGEGNLEIREFTEEKEKTIAAALTEVGEVITNITYSRLVQLRNNNELIPGKQYRIIDYSTFTGQENTASAGHDFDIIVIADTENTLNENARAVKKENDTYFTEDLSKWELKYSLDNDEKYSWSRKYEIKENKIIVDGEEQVNYEEILIDEGKGVIYYMKDGNNNECPYDFKNILFDYSVLGVYGYYGGEPEEETEVNKKQLMVYTFNGIAQENENNDYTTTPWCHDNVIKEYINDSNNLELNFNVFIGTGGPYNKWYGNYLDTNCKMNTFGSNVYNVKFGTNCSNNVLMNDCHNVIFNKSCCSNILMDNCYSVSFGNNCSRNTFGAGSTHNTFGNGCWYNTFGGGCQYNTFGNNCQSNTFGDNCWYNTLGNNCNDNTFGGGCWYNTFGNNCESNTFGNNCESNTFGNSCYSNTFGNYFISNTLGENIQYVVTVDDSASESSSVKYVKILNGTQGTDENKLHITFTKLSGNDKYCQYAGINSKGELKVWCFADMFE